MEEQELKPVKLTLETNGGDCTAVYAWDANLYDLLNAFIGVCTSVGFHTDSINEVIKEYAETIEDND